jgi:hypothetical protein
MGVAQLLLEYSVEGGTARLIGPVWLRSRIRGTAKAVQTACKADVKHVVPLLAYCLEDVFDESDETGAQLDGLPLVPLASGGLGTLRSAGDQALNCWCFQAASVMCLGCVVGQY